MIAHNIFIDGVTYWRYFSTSYKVLHILLKMAESASEPYLWRYGDEKVDVIFGYVLLHDFHGLSAANLSDQFSGFESNVTNGALLPRRIFHAV